MLYFGPPFITIIIIVIIVMCVCFSIVFFLLWLKNEMRNFNIFNYMLSSISIDFQWVFSLYMHLHTHANISPSCTCGERVRVREKPIGQRWLRWPEAYNQIGYNVRTFCAREMSIYWYNCVLNTHTHSLTSIKKKCWIHVSIVICFILLRMRSILRASAHSTASKSLIIFHFSFRVHIVRL